MLEIDEIEPRTVATSVVDPDPHHFGNLNPHRIKIRIRIRIKVIRWIRNRIRIRISLQMTSQIYGIRAYLSTFLRVEPDKPNWLRSENV
jgi:hypothetical protein